MAVHSDMQGFWGKFILPFLLFSPSWRRGLAMWLTWSSLCRPCCPPTHRDLPAPASHVLGLKNVCHHTQLPPISHKTQNELENGSGQCHHLSQSPSTACPATSQQALEALVYAPPTHPRATQVERCGHGHYSEEMCSHTDSCI